MRINRRRRTLLSQNIRWNRTRLNQQIWLDTPSSWRDSILSSLPIYPHSIFVLLWRLSNDSFSCFRSLFVRSLSSSPVPVFKKSQAKRPTHPTILIHYSHETYHLFVFFLAGFAKNGHGTDSILLNSALHKRLQSRAHCGSDAHHLAFWLFSGVLLKFSYCCNRCRFAYSQFFLLQRVSSCCRWQRSFRQRVGIVEETLVPWWFVWSVIHQARNNGSIQRSCCRWSVSCERTLFDEMMDSLQRIISDDRAVWFERSKSPSPC